MNVKRLLHDVVRASAFAVFVAPIAVAAQGAGVNAIREQPADQQILHALNRLAFGPRPGDVQKVRATDLDNWIEQQLHPERIPDAGMQQALARYSTFSKSETYLLRRYVVAQRDRRQMRADSGRTMAREDSIAQRQRGEQLRSVVTSARTVSTPFSPVTESAGRSGWACFDRYAPIVAAESDAWVIRLRPVSLAR